MEDKRIQETNIQKMDMNELDQVNGGGLVDWVVKNIAAPAVGFFEACEFHTAQSTMMAELHHNQVKPF